MTNQQGAPEALTDFERRHAIRQGYEIAASDGYFEARPKIDSNDRRKAFQAGFERGWDRHAALVEAQQHARIAELEAQLEAIGAGGVSGPLVGQPQAMPDLSALTERGAKAWAGVDAQELREGFSAADMATASAQGFRDGVASSGGDDESIQQAEIDLHRLQHIESAALLALGMLWMTERHNHKAQAAFQTLRNALGGMDALRKGIEAAIDARYEADHQPCADWWAGKKENGNADQA